MYVNPFPFGVFMGVIATISLEVAVCIIAVLSHKRGKK